MSVKLGPLWCIITCHNKKTICVKFKPFNCMRRVKGVYDKGYLRTSAWHHMGVVNLSISLSLTMSPKFGPNLFVETCCNKNCQMTTSRRHQSVFIISKCSVNQKPCLPSLGHLGACELVITKIA